MSELETAIASLKGEVPDAKEYARLCTLYLDDPIADKLTRMDPFSSEYRDIAMQLYRKLRGPKAKESYNPENQRTNWQFRIAGRHLEAFFTLVVQKPLDGVRISDFMGDIMQALALPPDSSASILEYGSGSGQLLLFLARMGLDVYAVDIDQPSLDLSNMLNE